MYTRPFGGSRHVTTPEGPATLRVHQIGPHPILLHFLGRMDFLRIVRSCLATPGSMIVDHARTLAVLIQNILLSPAPLYRIGEWADPIDPAALALSASEKDSLNDDRIARTLDALVSVRARGLFFQLALHIIKQFELDTRRIHHDTTTVTFHGQYATSVREPRIARGISKDHRPDLKQLVFGLNVTADGAVPISHEIYSGNRTDDTVHRSNVDRLREILGGSGFIYVADSKLCTRKNMAHVARYGGQFVTVLPRTRAEDKRFRAALRAGEKVRWRKLLDLVSSRHPHDPPDCYYSTSDGPGFSSEGYRIVWIRSSQKKEQDALVRETALRRAETELFELGGRLNRGQLKTRAAIGERVRRILRHHKCERFLHVHIASRTKVETRRLRPGRPRLDDPVEIVRTRIYELQVQRNKQALKAEARTDGVFPLLTNADSRQLPKKEVLLIYKYQPYVEKRHSLLKTELEVAPVYLKKPLRAAGLVHACFLAMILDALIERTLRLGMKREGLEALPILPEGRMTRTPTTARVLEMFTDVSWYEFERGGDTVTFPIQLSALQKQLLQLLDMDTSIYA
jgi:transposase